MKFFIAFIITLFITITCAKAVSFECFGTEGVIEADNGFAVNHTFCLTGAAGSQKTPAVINYNYVYICLLYEDFVFDYSTQWGYFTHCSIQSYRCPSDWLYSDWGCQPCHSLDGDLLIRASIEDPHQNGKTCEYCPSGYYKPDNNEYIGCRECPGDGKTTDHYYARRTISDCFLPIGTKMTDSTGDYELSSDCYYQK